MDVVDDLVKYGAWFFVAITLVAICIVLTQDDDVRRYRVRLICSVLAMEYFVWISTYVSLVAGTILLVVTIRYMVVPFSHVLSQKMANKVTDSMFGDREPARPTLEFKLVREMRGKGKSEEVINHLQEVLAKTPEDFECRFLMATIYAEDIRDLSRAEEEIEALQKMQTITPSQKAMARQKLHTWREATYAKPKPVVKEPVYYREGDYHPPTTPNPIIQAEPGTEPKRRDRLMPVNLPVTYQSIEDLCRAGQYGSAVKIADVLLEDQREDLKAWALKASVYVRFLKQPSLADESLKKILNAIDIQPEAVEAISKLAEDYAQIKEDRMKAPRIWRKLMECASVTLEQKIVLKTRLSKFEM